MKTLFLLLSLCSLAMVSCDKLFHNEPTTTTFTITKNSTFDVISIGANIAINYKITKPIEGVSIVATPSAEWITESASLDNALVFTVAENDTDTTRNATITLLYNDIERIVTINQSAAGSQEGEYTQFEHLSGHYWGNKFSNNDSGHHYALILGDSGNCRDLATGDLNLVEGNTYLFIELFASSAPEKLNCEFNVPIGNYVLDHSNSAVSGTIAELPTHLYYEDGKEGVETEFANGSVTVTEEAIYANFVDYKGKEYKYCCLTTFVDNASDFGPVSAPKDLSTLTQNIDIELSNTEFYAYSYDDLYLIGKQYWDIFLIDNTTGDSFSTILLTDLADKMPLGTFPVSTDLNNKQIALPGYLNCEEIMVWSWYTLFSSDRTILGAAPLMDGELTIEDKGANTYTITIDVLDDLGNRITTTCTTSLTDINTYIEL